MDQYAQVAARAPHGIRCILFDLGSTLWERQPPDIMSPLEREADAAALAVIRALLLTPAGASFSMAESSEGDAVHWAHELRSHVHHALQSTYREQSLYEPDFAAVHLSALQAIGMRTDDSRWGAMLYEALRVRSSGGRRLFPDALSTLNALRQRGYTLGIVTNREYGGPIFLDDLRRLGLLQFFAPESIAVSANLRFRKPHRMMFQYALAGIGIPASEAAMVGDRLLKDVLGANQLGIYSVWKRPGALSLPDDNARLAPTPIPDIAPETTDPGMALPDAVISHLSELLTLFP